MGLANVPAVKAIRCGPLRFLRKQKCVRGNWQKIIDCELKIWGLFLKYPRFITPKSFLRDRLKIQIYTDACAKPPFEKETINWPSGVGIGGILIVEGKVIEFPSLEVNTKAPPLARRTKISPQAYKFL